ncbi:MAG: hypothetical protein ACKO2M_02825, partial [Actinomycetota bacterium]
MSQTIVKPSRPWLPSPRERATDLGFLLITCLTSYAIVELTPMKGKLAYFFVFFFAFALYNLIKGSITRDFMNGVDQFFSIVMLLGMTLVIIPTADILYTVFDKGRKGIH